MGGGIGLIVGFKGVRIGCEHGLEDGVGGHGGDKAVVDVQLSLEDCASTAKNWANKETYVRYVDISGLVLNCKDDQAEKKKTKRG
jgi:hypothetical protein